MSGGKEVISKFGIEVTGAEKLGKADAEGDDLETTLHALVAALDKLSAAVTENTAGLGGVFSDAADEAEEATKKTEGFGDSLKKIGAAVAAYAGVDAMRDMITDTIDLGNEIATMSARVGISTDEWQRWSAVGKMVGVQSEDLGGAMKGLAKNAQEAQKAGSTQAKIFDELGVKTTDANGSVKNAGQLMKETGLALGGLSDEGRAAQLTMQLMEDAGLKLLPAFKKGEKELDRLLGTVDEFGMMTPETIAEMQKAREEQVKWELATQSLKTALTSVLLPALSKAMGVATRFAKVLSTVTANSELLKAIAAVAGGVMVVMGIKSAAAWGPVALKVMGTTLLLAIAAIAVEDFFATFQGKDTLIRRAFENADGSMTKFGQSMHQAMNALDAFFAHFSLDVKENISWKFRAIGQAIVDAKNAVGEFFDDVATGVGVKFEESGVEEFFKDLAEVPGQTLDAIDSALTAIEDTADEWVEAGKSLIAGVAKGITEGAGDVADAAVTAVGDALGLTRAVNVVKSPSEKWADKLGAPLMQGVAVGMDDQRSGVVEASTGAIAAASLAGRGAIGGAPSAGRGGVEINNSWTIYANGAAGESLGSSIRGALAPSSADADRALLAALELG